MSFRAVIEIINEGSGASAEVTADSLEELRTELAGMLTVCEHERALGCVDCGRSVTVFDDAGGIVEGFSDEG